MEKTTRVELKFPIHKNIVRYVQEDIKSHVILDKYIKPDTKDFYRIRSLYFENSNLIFYREKLAGINERVKLRARTYFPIKKKNGLYLEIKYRKNIQQKKIRHHIDFDSYNLLLMGRYNDLIKKFPRSKELQLFISLLLKYAAKPSIIIDYDRKAFVSKYNSQYMRLTFDNNFFFKRTSNIYDNQKGYKNLVDRKYVTLEMKFKENIPYWMQNIIRKYNLRASALSKYASFTRRTIS